MVPVFDGVLPVVGIEWEVVMNQEWILDRESFPSVDIKKGEKREMVSWIKYLILNKNPQRVIRKILIQFDEEEKSNPYNPSKLAYICFKAQIYSKNTVYINGRYHACGCKLQYNPNGVKINNPLPHMYNTLGGVNKTINKMREERMYDEMYWLKMILKEI